MSRIEFFREIKQARINGKYFPCLFDVGSYSVEIGIDYIGEHKHISSQDLEGITWNDIPNNGRLLVANDSAPPGCSDLVVFNMKNQKRTVEYWRSFSYKKWKQPYTLTEFVEKYKKSCEDICSDGYVELHVYDESTYVDLAFKYQSSLDELCLVLSSRAEELNNVFFDTIRYFKKETARYSIGPLSIKPWKAGPFEVDVPKIIFFLLNGKNRR